MSVRFSFYSFLFAFVLFMSYGICSAESPLIDNGDGTFSLENGIYLRHYEGYSEESQRYLSVLDACYSTIGAYSEIIDPYTTAVREIISAPTDGTLFFAHHAHVVAGHSIVFRLIPPG